MNAGCLTCRHNEPPLVIHINFYTAKVDEVYFPQVRHRDPLQWLFFSKLKSVELLDPRNARIIRLCDASFILYVCMIIVLFQCAVFLNLKLCGYASVVGSCG